MCRAPDRRCAKNLRSVACVPAAASCGSSSSASTCFLRLQGVFSSAHWQSTVTHAACYGPLFARALHSTLVPEITRFRIPASESMPSQARVGGAFALSFASLNERVWETRAGLASSLFAGVQRPYPIRSERPGVPPVLCMYARAKVLFGGPVLESSMLDMPLLRGANWNSGTRGGSVCLCQSVCHTYPRALLPSFSRVGVRVFGARLRRHFVSVLNAFCRTYSHPIAHDANIQ